MISASLYKGIQIALILTLCFFDLLLHQSLFSLRCLFHECQPRVQSAFLLLTSILLTCYTALLLRTMGCSRDGLGNLLYQEGLLDSNAIIGILTRFDKNRLNSEGSSSGILLLLLGL